VVLKKTGESVKRSGEPVVQDLRGGARRRRGDYEVFDDGGEQLPVGLVTSKARGGLIRGRGCE